MRFIYTDEAGTSIHEPVRVVASVIVNADTQLSFINSAINNLYEEYIPKELKENFWFHATEVYSGGKNIDRDNWKFSSRLNFI